MKRGGGRKSNPCIVVLLFVLLSALARASLVDQRNRRGNAWFTYENRERPSTRMYRMKSVISGFWVQRVCQFHHRWRTWFYSTWP